MIKKAFFYVFIPCSLGVLCLGMFTLYFLYGVLKHNSGGTEIIIFEIEKGATSEDIAVDLFAGNYIDSPFVFKLYARLFNKKGFIAGKHEVGMNMNILELIEILSSADVIPEDREIRIIEGWTLDEIALYLDKERVVAYDEFIAYAKNPPQELIDKYPQIFYGFENGMILEGYLFPDTYKVFKNATPEDIVVKMLDNLKTKLDKNLLQEISAQNKTIREIIIMASILEKEVRSRDEKKKVADIFYKRINKGMLLQADSTINYITKKGTASSSYKDIAIDNPYNTYKYVGLPFGPISNPGFYSIEAAVHPEKNNYYFFLTSKDGTVYYAETFEGHISNRQYLD